MLKRSQSQCRQVKMKDWLGCEVPVPLWNSTALRFKWSLDFSKDFLVAKKVASLKWACPLGSYSSALPELRNILVGSSKMFTHLLCSWCVKGSFCAQSILNSRDVLKITCHKKCLHQYLFFILFLNQECADMESPSDIYIFLNNASAHCAVRPLQFGGICQDKLDIWIGLELKKNNLH